MRTGVCERTGCLFEHYFSRFPGQEQGHSAQPHTGDIKVGLGDRDPTNNANGILKVEFPTSKPTAETNDFGLAQDEISDGSTHFGSDILSVTGPTTQWTRIDATIDSGSAVTCFPFEMIPEGVKIDPVGDGPANYISASNNKVEVAVSYTRLTLPTKA